MIYLVNETWPEAGDTSGKMYATLLRAAGLSPDEVKQVSLFTDKEGVFGPKSEAAPGFKGVRAKTFITAKGAEQLEESLFLVTQRAENDWVVPMGPIACWAIIQATDLTRRRGALHDVHVVPTYSPAQVTRQYLWFPLVASDLAKVADADRHGLEEPKWDLRPRPTIEELRAFAFHRLETKEPIVFDIETSPKFRAITAIGLGSGGVFMCVPFVDEEKRGASYWDRGVDEYEAVCLIKRVLERPGIVKIAHHSSYDTTWLWTIFGIRVAGPLVDTRIMHHTLVAELPHTLGSIAHTYMLLPPWKSQHAESKETD